MSDTSMFLLHYLLIFLAVTRHCVELIQLESPAASPIKHIVHPTVHHGRTKREISSTRDTNGEHYPEVHVTVPVEGSPWVLELRLNEELVAGGHTLQYQQGGQTVHHKPNREELDLCHYSGRVRGKPQSWVAVSTCRGVTGVIFDGQRMINIEPALGPDVHSPHYLYEHEFTLESLASLRGVAVDNIAHHPELSMPRRQLAGHPLSVNKSRPGRYKRETENNQVREPYSANNHSRYVELVIIADHSVFLKSGSTQAVHSEMIQAANVLNSIYTPINIYIALVGVVVWSERDEIYMDDSMSQTLQNLKSYRRKLVNEIPNDSSPLVTRRSFKEGYAGLGFNPTMCSSESSCSVTRICPECYTLPYVIAHEMGHNFGLPDEGKDCKCQAKLCVMSGQSGTSHGIGMWSDCSVKSFRHSLETERFDCVYNVPKRLFNTPTCGNGFVEPGEQCDCGITDEGGTNPCHACCHPDTCMLRENATCGTGACCDFTSCRLKLASVVCRSAERECDLPEYCTGHSEHCPADVYKMDSTRCGVGDYLQMCLKSKCVIRRKVTTPSSKSSECSSKCSGRGICNSEGHCHCEAGLAPPHCKAPGAGGSVDSGPATDISDQRNFMISMYAIFLGIIPLIALPFCLFYWRHDVLIWWKRPKNSCLQCVTCCTNQNSTNKLTKENITGTEQLTSPVKTSLNNEKTTKKINKDDIQIVYNDATLKSEQPVLKNNKEDIRILTNDVKFRPVGTMPNINNSNLPIMNNNIELNHVKPVLNNNEHDILTEISNVKLKSTNSTSKIIINSNEIATRGVILKTVEPKSNINNDNIEIAINNVKLKHVKPMINMSNKKDIQKTTNEVKLKHVEPISNINKDNVQIAINNVKLKPVKPISKIVKNGDQVPANDVKLKPVTNKPKPSIMQKPKGLNSKSYNNF